MVRNLCDLWALQLVCGLPSPEAAFQQGVILRQLAEQTEADEAADLLRQSLESFYLTLDRLRDPLFSAPQQLRDDLAVQIREVEAMRMEETASSTHVNGFSSVQAGQEGGLITPRRPATGVASVATSTPRLATVNTPPRPADLSSSFGNESRPSLDRVCAELMSLKTSQQAILRLLSERRSESQPTEQSQRNEPPAPLLDELRASLEDVRIAVAEVLRDSRQSMQQLRPAPPLVSPEMYGYMVALANMRGVPMLPLGPPGALPYPAHRVPGPADPGPAAAAPANVTVSSREALPAPDSAVPSVPPSVIVPPEHRKPPVVSQQQIAATNGQKSPHQFQIQLPSSAQLSVTSPLADSDKPAFSRVSTLPNIPAPQYSAVSPLPGRQGPANRSPGRERLDSTGSFHEDPEYEPMADFKPIVPLPEEVEVRTGEEGDTPLFAARCKLYRFTDAEWKERGVGELRVLYRQDDGRVRLVMRRDQTHKVCANHFLQPGMQLNAMKDQPRAATWAAKDFADEELKDERLCARFKTEEIADEFRAAFEKGKQLVSSGSGGRATSTLSSRAASAKPAAAKPADAKTSASSIHTAAATEAGSAIPTVVAAAGRGAEDEAEDDDDEYETEEETTTSEDDDDEEPSRIACKPEFNFASSGDGSGAAFSFGFGASPAASTSSAASTAASTAAGFKFGDKVPPAATAATFQFGFGKAVAAPPSTTAGFTFGSPKLATEAATPDAGSGFKFGQSSGSTAKTSLGGFSFTATPSVKEPEPEPEAAAAAAAAAPPKPSPFAGFTFGTPASAGEAKPLFSSDNAASFATVAAQPGSGFKKDDSFKGFTGFGAPVFGASPSAAAAATATDGADTSVEEYEPSVHFEPVVPLPELVETRTGEESEEKLFGCRAKLYRMDRDLKEWKERGVGEIKILKNADTGKCRVLMRREQVLKLCANHVIAPEMTLSRLSSSETAWLWSANDFSEGEASQEMLAARFKTVEQADAFREVFESCRQGAPVSRLVQTPQTAKAKQAPGDQTPTQATKSSDGKTSSQLFKPADAKTPAQTERLASAKTPAQAAKPAVATPSAIGTASGSSKPASASFVFGADSPAAGPGQFHFSGVKPKSPTKPRSRDVSLNESAAGDDNEYYEGDEGEHLLFEPVIPLPDKVEVKTGEEDEEVLYSHRCKLYRFEKETGEWKERGLGDIKLLEHRQTKKIRLLMRREQVLKICLNHRLTAELEFSMKDDKSVVWACTDYAEAEPRDEVLTARFKTPQVAADFVAAVQKAQARLNASPSKLASPPVAQSSVPAAPASEPPGSSGAGGGSGGPGQATSIFGGGGGGGSVGASPSSGFSFGSRFGSAPTPEKDGPSASFTFRLSSAGANTAAPAQDSDPDEVQIVGEIQPTAEQRAAAARLQLPAGFFLYEQRPPCPGCRGCRDQMPGEQSAAGDTRPDDADRSAAKTAAGSSTPASSSVPASSSAGTSSPFQFSSFAFGSDQTKAGQATGKATFGFGSSSAASSPFSFSTGTAKAGSGVIASVSGGETSSIFGGLKSDNKTSNIFGGSGAEIKTNIFGGSGSAANSVSIFSGSGTENKVGSIFGGTGADSKGSPFAVATGTGPKTGSIFGTAGTDSKTGSIFGAAGLTQDRLHLWGTGTDSKTGSIFGGTGTDSKTGSIFGGTGTDSKTGTIFGGTGTDSKTGSIFGTAGADSKVGSIFGTVGTEGKSGSIFGGTGNATGTASTPSSVFGGLSASKVTFATEGSSASGQDTNGVRAEQPAAGAADQPTFGFALQSSGPAVDFASFAQSGETFAKKADPSFQFSGAGSTLFGARPAAAADTGSDDEAAADDSAHDPQFEPVVPLPELVDVRTGEEGEQKLFSHRAILYRFNNATAEWKERGRGDFKLLHNPDTGSYRLLLRREQVHKLACNHRVTTEMALSRLGSSTSAWVWSAVDYADEEPRPETLAVKFKTEALADQFKQAFDAVLEKLKDGETAATAAAEEEEEEEEEDDDSPMFEKRATLHVVSGADKKTLGTGDLRVVYDDEVFGVKVVMTEDKTGVLLCDSFITMQHTYQLEDKMVTWTARDYALEPVARRTVCAQFASAAAARDLARVMDEGVEIATSSDISEALTLEAGEPQGSGDED
ncbi:LOW QUALITY PROTEIN: E3 SUMO-protein ligase RanBP2-like [Pollicipes pollicipes]|uniref:LOW QUALITY PROTEIN: E3 SUMO-protein ligase RanBP2-like n=1 Tax=Pollicipes pollicipes TaxID=41117 RepID=UPI001884955F|nr:LOW QUALITY PROTEIN: E3 SUMO-protein ligase RanBP2-like [Pollicipes pollicipes]